MRSMVSVVGLGLMTAFCSGCATDAGSAPATNENPPGSGGGLGSGGSGGTAGSGGNLGPPAVSVLDAHPVLTETTAHVHVVLSHPYDEVVGVEFSTADGTATSAAGDYQAVTKTLSFAPGTTEQVVAIPVQTPYKTLTLDGSLNRWFETKLDAATGATIADADGKVTLAHAGMVIETPLAARLLDGDIAPDFNGDDRADLVLSGSGGKACVLLTPGTIFDEAEHVVVDAAYLDEKRAFSYVVSGGGMSMTNELVAGDQSMAADHDGDGLTDLLVIGESKAHILFGHTGPFFHFVSGDPRLGDGQFGTALSDVSFGYGSDSLQIGDYDGDGTLDFAQAHHYSSAAGGSEQLRGFHGGSYGSGTFIASTSFSFTSGTTPVGQASLSNGTRPGVRGDLDGDGKEDLIFVGIAANDGIYGGNYLYVRFNDGQKLTQQNLNPKESLDGSSGFYVANDNYLSNWSNYVPQDTGDVNGDQIPDLVLLGGGVPLSVVFGKKAPYAKGHYTTLQDMGAEVALFDTDTVASARIGDLNRDGIGDVVFITENKLRVLWGKQDLAGKPIFGTQYPEMGEVEIDPASGLDSVGVVGDLDGDMTEDVIVFSQSYNDDTGAALILFGKTLTRLLGGPDLTVAPPH